LGGKLSIFFASKSSDEIFLAQRCLAVKANMERQAHERKRIREKESKKKFDGSIVSRDKRKEQIPHRDGASVK